MSISFYSTCTSFVIPYYNHVLFIIGIVIGLAGLSWFFHLKSGQDIKHSKKYMYILGQNETSIMIRPDQSTYGSHGFSIFFSFMLIDLILKREKHAIILI